MPLIIRPKIKRPRTRRTSEDVPSVLDIGKEFSKISQLTTELETLKVQYRKKITDLDNLKDKTKENVKIELAVINKKFIKDALILLDKSSVTIFADLKRDVKDTLVKMENKVSDAENAITDAVKIKKGDQGDPGKPGISPDITAIVSKVLLKTRPPKVIHGKSVDEGALMKRLLKLIFKNPLEIENVKGLENRLRNIGSKVMFGGGGQGSDKIKALSGTIDGSNTEFTYSGELPAENSERVFLNYQEQNPLTDYTISASGGTVTVSYTIAPDVSLSGLAHIIRYR